MLPDVWQRFFQQERSKRDELKLTRKLRPLRHLGSTKVQIGSHEFVNFSSNDYLGLTGDLRISSAAASAAGRYGWGAAASRLVTGSSTVHHKLESEVARFRGMEAALLFGSGYQANIGVLTALVDENDTVISDRMNHASIVAGCRLSGAKIKIFDHKDYDHLERILNSVKGGKVLVVTDSVFSVEGDVADLGRIAKLCERFKALLVVDDAHANACLGKKGRGVPEVQSVLNDIPVIVGSFSKSLGSYGGFVACSEELRDFLVNHSRPFIYTTALPAALAAANVEALKILRQEGEGLRQKLATNTTFVRGRLENAGFELTGNYHIIGIKAEGPEQALHQASEVEVHGLLVQPMRWPTVPEGRDCVRISVTAAHTEEELLRLVDALKKARENTTKKETSGVSRRQAKRPTHQSLESVDPQPMDSPGMDTAEPEIQEMTAIDSNRLPSADDLSDFPQNDASPGDTMIMEPVSSDAPTTKVPDGKGKDEDKERPKDDAQEVSEEKKQEEKKVKEKQDTSAAEEEKKDSKASNDDEPEPDKQPEEEPSEAVSDSGKTLAPEPAELADPIIAKIEKGTKRKKRKTKARKKS